MSKNQGPFLAFNDAFFNRHQRLLLWLLNAPVTKLWSRWILRIRHADCSLSIRISDIHTNRFSFGDRVVRTNGRWNLVRTTDFRTHPKYGKRVYYAFRPVWWILHFWDWLVADRMAPQWSFGFDTLTAYPDPGTGSTTVDGSIWHDEATWAGCRAATSTDGDDGSPDTAGTAADFAEASTGFAISRGFFLFDTAGLPDTATISAVVVSLYGRLAGLNNANTSDLDIVSSSPASNNDLIGADFDQVGSTVFSSKGLASWNTSGYNDFTLDSNGIANVSKTSISKFGTRISRDTDDAQPTGINRCGGSYADDTGTSKDPKLVVTYSTSTAWTQDLTETLTMTGALVNATTRTLSDILTITDSLIRSAVRTLTETLTITDILATAKIKAQELIETFTAEDSFIRSLIKPVTETATITDSVIKASERTVSETATITDAIVNTWGKVFAEVTTITDSIVRSITRTLSEVATITDILAPSFTYLRELTETLTLSDVLTKAYTKVLTEMATITDLTMSLWRKVTRATDATYTSVSRAASDVWNQLTRNE